MIELISEDRCVACNICVRVCPTNVFDEVADGIPAIARQDDCQTCFMCEAYCPVDALYVSTLAECGETINETALIADGLLGSYRRDIGWGKYHNRGAHTDPSYRVLFQAR
jgi:NAD-dependent dihydropyrimidine dehydrogenase PreA subunit